MLHELGKGAFATVMKALNRAEGQWYAVKIVHVRKLKLRDGWEKALEGGLPTDPNARKMLREIKILEKLEHRNVCQLKEVFLESHSICTCWVCVDCDSAHVQWDTFIVFWHRPRLGAGPGR